MPFYHQLKQLIIADIARHDRRPGDRLPGDMALCDTYGVSRTVVRQALGELELEGVIVRQKGRGTFVAPTPANDGLIARLTGLHHDLSARGVRLRSVVTSIGVAPADDSQAAALEIPSDASVVHIERLRLVGDKPLVFTVTDIPYDLAPGLEQADLTDRSLYDVLAADHAIRLVHSRRVVEATQAGVRLGRLLQVRSCDPLLVLRSVSTGEEGRPVESFVAFHRADRSRFEVELPRARSTSGVPDAMLVVTEPR